MEEAKRGKNRLKELRARFSAKKIVVIFLVLVSLGGITSAVVYLITRSTGVTFMIEIQSDTTWVGQYGTTHSIHVISGHGNDVIFFKGTTCNVILQETGSGYLGISIWVGSTLKASNDSRTAGSTVSVSATA
jgi:hypothetical protein